MAGFARNALTEVKDRINVIRRELKETKAGLEAEGCTRQDVLKLTQPLQERLLELEKQKQILLEAGVKAEEEGRARGTTYAEMASVLKGLQAVLPAMELLVQMYVNQFVYSASTASNSRQDDDFKLQLQTFYHNALDEQQCQLRCMLLNVQLPMTLVTGFHLFKHCWKPTLRTLLGLSDINDPRNGLLLFEPLQHAFDDSQVCFLYVEDAGEPKFKLELLDMSLKGVKLWDYAKTHNICKQYGEHQIGTYAATVTFGELQGKALVFEDSKRPYKRCLQFQAVQAVRQAKEKKWLPEDWAPSASLSYNTEDAKERMDAWLTFAVEAPPPPDSDSASDGAPGGGS